MNANKRERKDCRDDPAGRLYYLRSFAVKELLIDIAVFVTVRVA